MGYGGVGHFELVGRLLAQRPGVADRRDRICELGNQEIQVTREAADAMHSFAQGRRASNPALTLAELKRILDGHIGRQMYVRDVYLAGGFDYVSVDVNEEGGARFVDLNYWPNEAAALGKFDVVTNFGTSEHVANQASAFATVHHLLAPGGIAIHEIPMVHYLNHALVDVTPRFFRSLATLNDYTIVSARILTQCIDQAPAFHYGTDILFVDGAREMLRESTLAAAAFVVLRKNSDTPFIPPVDVGNDLYRFRRLLDAGLEHYNPGISAAQKDQAVRQAIERVSAGSAFKSIADGIKIAGYDGRLARTSSELEQAKGHDTRRGGARNWIYWKLWWVMRRSRSFLAPTFVGRIKRKLYGPK